MESLLTKLIEREEGSVNTLIRKTDIDRSTFYKIKKGTRKPKETHFCNIINNMKLVTDEEKILLIEEFEYRRYWKSQHREELDLARQFLRNLNHFDFQNDVKEFDQNKREEENTTAEEVPPSSTCSQKIVEFITGEINKPENKNLRMYIPARLLDFFNFTHHADKFPDDLKVTVIFSPSDDSSYDPVQKLRHVQRYFQFVERTDALLNVYRDHCSDRGCALSPYPYWIIAKERMMVIDQEIQNYEITGKQSIIDKYTDTFDKRLSDTYEIIREYNNLLEIMNDMNDKITLLKEKKQNLYILSSQPCTPLAISKEQIRKDVPDEMVEFFCHYHENITSALTCEFITLSGFQKMCESRTIPEWNIHLTIPEADLIQIKKNLKQRIENETLFFLSEVSGEVPENYSIAFFEGQEIHVQSLTKPSLVIQIKEQSLLDAMTKWFRYRINVADLQMMLGMTENPFDSN